MSARPAAGGNRRRGRRAPSRRRRLALAVAAVAVLAAVDLAAPAVAQAAPATPARALAPADGPLIDPGVDGPLAVDTLEYDLGDQAFTPEGFPSAVELRGEVYAPTTLSGRVPLVVLMHGRHVTCGNDQVVTLEWPCPAGVPEIPSYQGYRALGRNLASHGMVVVSIGANGINADDGYLDDGGASARAQLILEHLRRWKGWDASADGSPFADRFVGHLDLTRVGLMGHSRGGEGVAAAVQLNQRIGSPFGITTVVALAPVDFARRIVGGVSLSTILPYCDGDVSDLQGASYLDDGRYASPGDPTAKATTLLYGANHNFFNTVWTTGPGSGDDAAFGGIIDAQPSPTAAEPAPQPCEPGGVGRLTAPQQEQAGVTLMAGWFRRHLEPEPGLQAFVTGVAPFPASSGPARWSTAYHAPDRLDVESWSSVASYRRNRARRLAVLDGVSGGLVCAPDPQVGGEDGFAVTRPSDAVTTPCPGGATLNLTDDTGVLDVSWFRTGGYVRQELAGGSTDVTHYDGLRLRVAAGDDSRNVARTAQDFSVVLEDADGHRASVAAATGGNGLRRLNDGYPRHAVLTGLRFPLSAFAGVDLTRVRAVELRFDRTIAGRLSLSDLAFTQEGTGSAAAPTAGPPTVAPPRPQCRGSAAVRWACALAHQAWGRDPDPDEVRLLAAGYPTADARRRVVVAVVNGAAATDLRYRRFVEAFTQDDIDPGWLDSVLSPGGRTTWEVGLVDLVGGFAYASPSLSTTARTIGAAYEALTGRSPDPGGLAYWTPVVEAGGPAKLAASLVRTSAHRNLVVRDRYRQILGRAPDAAGLAYWAGRLASPGGEQALVTSLLTTESFRVAATA
jgi:hypothetical protein